MGKQEGMILVLYGLFPQWCGESERPWKIISVLASDIFSLILLEMALFTKGIRMKFS